MFFIGFVELVGLLGIIVGIDIQTIHLLTVLFKICLLALVGVCVLHFLFLLIFLLDSFVFDVFGGICTASGLALEEITLPLLF
jgi:hypothetical protein